MSVVGQEMWYNSTGSEETNMRAQDDKIRKLTTWKQMAVEKTMKP